MTTPVTLLTFAVTGDMPPPRCCIACGATCSATITGLRFPMNGSIPFPSADGPLPTVPLEPTGWVWPRHWLEVRISEAGVFSSDDSYYYACPTCRVDLRAALSVMMVR
jgi:hypothetical protein